MTTATLDRPKVAMNGVDVPTLLTTIGVVGENPEAAKFQFRAKGEWMDGTHSRATMNGFFGAGEEHTRGVDFVVEGDHPAVLCGGDRGASGGKRLRLLGFSGLRLVPPTRHRRGIRRTVAVGARHDRLGRPE